MISEIDFKVKGEKRKKLAYKIITYLPTWEYPKVCVNLQTDVR